MANILSVVIIQILPEVGTVYIIISPNIFTLHTNHLSYLRYTDQLCIFSFHKPNSKLILEYPGTLSRLFNRKAVVLRFTPCGSVRQRDLTLTNS